MLYHMEMGWLNWEKILIIIFELVEEIYQFMDNKGKESKVLWEEKWKCKLAFLVYITVHLSVLNIQLQGQDCMICNTYDDISSEADLWETQMH